MTKACDHYKPTLEGKPGTCATCHQHISAHQDRPAAAAAGRMLASVSNVQIALTDNPPHGPAVQVPIPERWGLRGSQIRAAGGYGHHVATYQTNRQDGLLLAAAPELRDLLHEACDSLDAAERASASHSMADRIRDRLTALGLEPHARGTPPIPYNDLPGRDPDKACPDCQAEAEVECWPATHRTVRAWMTTAPR